MSEINVDQARFNMVEQQIRPWEVLDQQVLDVIGKIPREQFVPQRYRNLAFADVRIPLGHGQVMMNPNVEGRLLQALAITAADNILEIGTGSGYLSACLTQLGNRVISVDIFADFTQAASQTLHKLGIKNINLHTGDAAQGWKEQRHDVIAVTGSLPSLPKRWRRSLNVGGRLFAIVGESPIMEALLITRMSEDEWTQESLFDTELPSLLSVSKPSTFVF